MMESPAPKEAIVVEICVKSEHSLGLEGVYIKSEPSLGDTCVKDEPSCSDTCVKDEPSSPEVADAPGVSEAAAAGRLYVDHVVKDELVLVQPRRVLCAAPGQKLLANVKQEQADPDEIAVTPMSVKQESEWEAEDPLLVQPKWETEMMVDPHGEPKNKGEENMPLPTFHGEPTVFNEEVKQELKKCEADDSKLNEPPNRTPAPNTLKRNGPLVYKRIWLADSDDAVIGSRSIRSPDKWIVAGSSPARPPAKRKVPVPAGSIVPVVVVTSQPTQPLITAIRESRCRNMLEMFPDISPSDIKNTLVKHGWNEKRARKELRSTTRKAAARLRRRARARTRILASPDKDPDLQYGRKEAAGGAKQARAARQQRRQLPTT